MMGANIENIDLNNSFWDRVRGFVSELRVDARWVLRDNDNDRALGSLRIVSHPDLRPGYLRAIFTYVNSISDKNKAEIMKTTEDYQMDVNELEVYSIDKKIDSGTKIIEAPLKELQDMFGVKIF